MGSSELNTVTAEPSWICLRAGGDRRQHHLGRGDRKIGAVMLAEPDEVDAEPIGQHAFFDHVADHLRMRQQRAIGAVGDVAKGIQSEFEGCGH